MCGPQQLTDPQRVHGESLLSRTTEDVPGDRECVLFPFHTYTEKLPDKGGMYDGGSGGKDGVGKLTLADLHDAHDDDEGECQQLAGGENVLHPGGPPHTGAVHPRQQH